MSSWNLATLTLTSVYALTLAKTSAALIQSLNLFLWKGGSEGDMLKVGKEGY
jgi:hypothetical protein